MKDAIKANGVCFVLILNKQELYLSDMKNICEKLNYTLADFPFTGIRELITLLSFFYLYNHPEEKFGFYYGKINFIYMFLEKLFHAKEKLNMYD